MQLRKDGVENWQNQNIYSQNNPLDTIAKLIHFITNFHSLVEQERKETQSKYILVNVVAITF